MISIEQVIYILPVLALTVSILYYAMVLRNSNKAQQMHQDTRNAQFFMQFANAFHTASRLNYWIQIMDWEWDDYTDFERKYGSENHPEMFGDRYAYWVSLNDLGYMVEKGIVQIEDVNALIGQFAIWTWVKFEEIILEHRRVYNLPDELSYWEKLVEKMMDYRKKSGVLEQNPEYFAKYLSSIEQNR